MRGRTRVITNLGYPWTVLRYTNHTVASDARQGQESGNEACAGESPDMEELREALGMVKENTAPGDQAPGRMARSVSKVPGRCQR